MIFFSIANKQEKCIVEVTETLKLMFFTAENNLSHRSVVNNKYLKFKTVKWIETSLSRLTKIRNKNNKQKKNKKNLTLKQYCYARLLKIA